MQLNSQEPSAVLTLPSPVAVSSPGGLPAEATGEGKKCEELQDVVISLAARDGPDDAQDKRDHDYEIERLYLDWAQDPFGSQCTGKRTSRQRQRTFRSYEWQRGRFHS